MSEENVITTLTDTEALDFLAANHLGRLVVSLGDEINIYPVNYVLDRTEGRDPSIVFRTAEGSKLVSLTVNDQVLFEVDDYQDDEAMSVIIRGTASRLTSTAEILEADNLDLKPWVPTLKYNYVRISINSLSGRHFVLGDEPDRYESPAY